MKTVFYPVVVRAEVELWLQILSCLVHAEPELGAVTGVRVQACGF
jgi:hypothetical protein